MWAARVNTTIPWPCLCLCNSHRLNTCVSRMDFSGFAWNYLSKFWKKMRACRCNCGGQRCKPHRPSSYTDKHWIVCNSHWLNSVSKRKSNYRFTVRIPPCEIMTSTLRSVQYYIIFYHVVSHAWFYMGNCGWHCFVQCKMHFRFRPNYFDFSELAPFFFVHQTSARYVIGETFPTCLLYAHAMVFEQVNQTFVTGIFGSHFVWKSFF